MSGDKQQDTVMMDADERARAIGSTRTPEQQRALLREIEILMRDERLEEGDSWFLVATQWWNTHIGASSHDRVDPDETMAAVSATQVTNEPLVDVAFSSKKRKSVVLKPMLAEGRDYKLVGESVWNRLSHEFGCDWEIAREVIAWGPTRKLLVEVYPVLFQVFVWQSGMETPTAVLDTQSHEPLVVIASASAPLFEVQQTLWRAMKAQLKTLVPAGTRTADLERFVRVSYRVAETAPWVPLVAANGSTLTSTSSASSTTAEPQSVGFRTAAAVQNESMTATTTTVGALELEARDYREGTARCHDLLVETRFTNASDPTDWRNGRFLSDIEANAWRFELTLDQLVDALDSDSKWYESRVINLDDKSVKVHYRGWTAKWDEWLPRLSERLAPLHTRVRNWRAFQVRDHVQVGFAIPMKNFPEWRNGVVLEVKPRDGDDPNALEIKIDIDGKHEWRDAQDELLCAPGTHRAVNAAAVTVKPTMSTMSNSYNRSSDRMRDHSSSGFEYGRGKPEHVGVVGLQNLGNTCFLNSMLQCLINTPALREYFLRVDAETGAPAFEREINRTNPLGMKGMIAVEFAALVRRMWGGEFAVVAPTKLKAVIGRYAPQFAGYQQQDSQEVMNFLLDGLHEDLNRVQQKPYTPAVEANGRPDDVVAQDEWDAYRKRNDSVVVDHFMGQLRSHLTCANAACGHESVTFDPFMSLSVPIPSADDDDAMRVALHVQLFWADGRIPMKYAVHVRKHASTLRDVRAQLSALSGVPAARLFFVEVWKHRILRALGDAKAVTALNDSDTLHAYELEVPVSEYEFSSKSLELPPAGAAARMALKVASVPAASLSSLASEQDDATPAANRKAMRLVALLHQAPCASPIDSRAADSDDPSSASDGGGGKQRRVEVELFNTPLLVSIPQQCSKAQVHAKVWQVVQRLVSSKANDDDVPSAFGCGADQSLPYRLHVTQPNGATSIIRDFTCADEPADLPDPTDRTHCFTVEWSRHGYQQGYDESSAKRIALHESMQQLRISREPKRGVDLLQCLSKFTEREQLGETDTWYCPKCKDHVRAIKKFDLFALPRVLIFQLKRFRYAQGTFAMHRDKISTLVSFPVASLDLSDHVLGPQRGSTLIYDLYAVSEHSGGLGGGHYTAVAKNPQSGRWFSFNDSFTNETTAEKAVTPRAYVLFYVRRE